MHFSPCRYRLCPDSRSARPVLPIPPIAAARFSVALRPTPREWVLSPSLRSLLSFRAWWCSLTSLAHRGQLPCRRARAVLVSSFVSAGVYARLRADARARRETRQTVRRSLTVRLLGGGRPPATTADLNGASSSGMLGQTPVNGRASHSGNAHQLTDFCSLRLEPCRERARAHLQASRELLPSSSDASSPDGLDRDCGRLAPSSARRDSSSSCGRYPA